MKDFAVWVSGPYAQDRLFDESAPVNRDDCLAPFRALKQALAASGWNCHTHDFYQAAGTVPEIVLFLDIPGQPVSRLLSGWHGKSRPWVILQECEVIMPRNWRRENHSQFEKVFTWAKDLWDGGRFLPLFFANRFPKQLPPVPFEEKALCAMIAGNKSSSHGLELYSERLRAIRWFEANHPGDFALYGAGWDRRRFNGPLRFLNRVPLVPRLLAPVFPSYRGAVPEKRGVLRGYRFSICYENARDIAGYITEKIFDSFFAGCVPVYWGAPDILDYVPSECFVDRRGFGSYEDLYSFLRDMPRDVYERKIAAIAAYLSGGAASRFGAEFYGRTIAEAVISLEVSAQGGSHAE